MSDSRILTVPLLTFRKKKAPLLDHPLVRIPKKLAPLLQVRFHDFSFSDELAAASEKLSRVTLEELLLRLTDKIQIPQLLFQVFALNFRECIDGETLTTLRSFTTPIIFLRKLLKLLEDESRRSRSVFEFPVSLAHRDRVLTILQVWVNMHWSDFRKDMKPLKLRLSNYAAKHKDAAIDQICNTVDKNVLLL